MDEPLHRWLAGMSLPSVGRTGQIVISDAPNKEYPFALSERQIYAGIVLKAAEGNAGTVEVFLHADDTQGFPLSTDGLSECFEVRYLVSVYVRGTNNGDVVYYWYS